MSDSSPITVRTRTRPEPVAMRWPNGAQIIRQSDKGSILLGWSIRIKKGVERFWRNKENQPVLMGDFPSFCDGLEKLSALFPRKPEVQAVRTRTRKVLTTDKT